MQTDELKKKYDQLKMQLHPDVRQLMEQWATVLKQYESEFFEFDVRGKKIKLDLTYQSLSGTRISKVYSTGNCSPSAFIIFKTIN